MSKVRDSLLALALSYLLALAGSEKNVNCHRQGHRRTDVPRRFEALEKSGSSDAIKPTALDDKYGRDRYHSAAFLNSRMNCNANSPILTFGLNENGVSGGFGDRLRGMVTTYYMAMMTNSSFEVNWTRPYNLSDYFLVPSCHARAWPEQIKAVGDHDVSHRGSNHGGFESDSKTLRSAIDVWTYFTDSLFLNDTGKNLVINTNSFHWKYIVRNKALEDRAASLGLAKLSQAELFKLAIDDLLGNPTSLVRESHASVLRRLAGGHEPSESGPSYVGVQIRLGGDAVSGWEDPSRHSMDDVQCFAKEAVQLCRVMHIRSIFVTADSEAAVRAFEEGVSRESSSATGTTTYPSPPIVVQVPGVIAHTDRSDVAEDHAREVWLKSILDWWMLKHASALVVSRSGFGETAAMASDAALALRHKQPFARTTSQEGEGGSSRCLFDDMPLRDGDIFH